LKNLEVDNGGLSGGHGVSGEGQAVSDQQGDVLCHPFPLLCSSSLG